MKAQHTALVFTLTYIDYAGTEQSIDGVMNTLTEATLFHYQFPTMTSLTVSRAQYGTELYRWMK